MNRTVRMARRATGGQVATIRGTVAITAALDAMFLGPLATAAHAGQAYPPAVPCTVGLSTAGAGSSSLTIAATGFAPDTAVTLKLRPAGVTLGSAVTDADGAVSLTVDSGIALTGPGSVHAQSAECSADGSFTVRSASDRSNAASMDSALPNTGSPDLELLGVAGALIGTGTLLVIGLRRRKV